MILSPRSQAQSNFRSHGFTTYETKDNDDDFQNHKRTKTVSTFETDGFKAFFVGKFNKGRRFYVAYLAHTPETGSPNDSLSNTDIEDEFLDVFGNQRDLSNDGSHGREKTLMRGLDKADPKISEEDAKSPVLGKSRKTLRTSEIALKNQKDETQEINLYIKREKANAVKNTSFSVRSLLKVMVFGVGDKQ